MEEVYVVRHRHLYTSGTNTSLRNVRIGVARDRRRQRLQQQVAWREVGGASSSSCEAACESRRLVRGTNDADAWTWAPPMRGPGDADAWTQQHRRVHPASASRAACPSCPELCRFQVTRVGLIQRRRARRPGTSTSLNRPCRFQPTRNSHVHAGTTGAGPHIRTACAHNGSDHPSNHAALEYGSNHSGCNSTPRSSAWWRSLFST